jgi:hypothetical protein
MSFSKKLKSPKLFLFMTITSGYLFATWRIKIASPFSLYSLSETSWKTDMLICLYRSCSAWSLKEWSPTTTLPIIAQLTPHPSHLHSQCTTCCMGIQHLNIKLYVPLPPLIITYYEKWVQKVTIPFETTTILNTHPFPSPCCSSFLIVTPTFNSSSISDSQQHSKYCNMD